jgi:hypothetical protein
MYQGLGKVWLPAFPRFPPLSGYRAGPLLGSPIANRVKFGSSESVNSEDSHMLLLVSHELPQGARSHSLFGDDAVRADGEGDDYIVVNH